MSPNECTPTVSVCCRRKYCKVWRQNYIIDVSPLDDYLNIDYYSIQSKIARNSFIISSSIDSYLSAILPCINTFDFGNDR